MMALARIWFSLPRFELIGAGKLRTPALKYLSALTLTSSILVNYPDIDWVNLGFVVRIQR